MSNLIHNHFSSINENRSRPLVACATSAPSRIRPWQGASRYRSTNAFTSQCVATDRLFCCNRPRTGIPVALHSGRGLTATPAVGAVAPPTLPSFGNARRRLARRTLKAAPFRRELGTTCHELPAGLTKLPFPGGGASPLDKHNVIVPYPSSRVAASPSSERRSLRHPVACPSGRETRRRHPARADRFAADGSRFPARSHHSPLCSLAPQPERPVRQWLLALWLVGAAKRKRLFTRAARKETALHVRSAIMPISSEVAPYDFRP